jgi:hypothetical protein
MAISTQMDFVPRKPMDLVRSLDGNTNWHTLRHEFLEGIQKGIVFFEFEEFQMGDHVMYNVFSFEHEDKAFTRFKLPHVHVNVHHSRPDLFHVTERCVGETFSHHYGKHFVRQREPAPQYARGWVTNNKGEQILANLVPITESHEILRAIFVAFVSFLGTPMPREIPIRTIAETAFDMKEHIFIDVKTLRAMKHHEKLAAQASAPAPEPSASYLAPEPAPAPEPSASEPAPAQAPHVKKWLPPHLRQKADTENCMKLC